MLHALSHGASLSRGARSRRAGSQHPRPARAALLRAAERREPRTLIEDETGFHIALAGAEFEPFLDFCFS
jgi:hypothetical protein